MTTIKLSPYDPSWPLQYEAYVTAIKASLGRHLLEAHHVGSTAVPGLCAKPIIDMILCVEKIKDVIVPLESLGYTFKGEINIPFRGYFSGKAQVHLHVYEIGHPEIALNLAFRDYLRANPDVRNQYGRLKEDLLKDPVSHEKGKGRFSGYTLGKSDFIKDVLHKADFHVKRMTHATHHDEWEAVKRFRQTYFFDLPEQQDPYIWTFTHPNHVHLVFYEGVEIVGYAHLQKWGTRACLRMIVLDLARRGRGLGAFFLDLCEKWLRGQGIKSLHLDASPASCGFYLKHGYTSAPVNDPDGHPRDPQDTSLAKVLSVMHEG